MNKIKCCENRNTLYYSLYPHEDRGYPPRLYLSRVGRGVGTHSTRGWWDNSSSALCAQSGREGWKLLRKAEAHFLAHHFS